MTQKTINLELSTDEMHYLMHVLVCRSKKLSKEMSRCDALKQNYEEQMDMIHQIYFKITKLKAKEDDR